MWFTAYCDFLISWDPFYYDITIGVSVGATFRMEICFFGCVDIDITVSLGADLHVLGPPFHGEVTVDLAVASVTVPFGDPPNQNKNPIPWGDFVTKYLHSGTPGNEPVIPHVIKGALGYGARYGQGVMSCRDDHGKWSPPSFISLAGGSINGTLTATGGNWTATGSATTINVPSGTFTVAGTGDLMASGTVSGRSKEARGCLLELTNGGAQPISLPGGEARR